MTGRARAQMELPPAPRGTKPWGDLTKGQLRRLLQRREIQICEMQNAQAARDARHGRELATRDREIERLRAALGGR